MSKAPAKFKVGDHVEVISEFLGWFCVGETGFIEEVEDSDNVWVTHDNLRYSVALVISPAKLKHSYIHNSPLLLALL